MPSITVVITAYNIETMIASCLNEILVQTFTDFNVLVVDDCSTDSTADIIQKYVSQYPKKISSIFLEINLGSPAKTRNVALDSGKIDGDCMVFLDGDDSIEPTFLEDLFELAQKTSADVAVCAYNRIAQETGHVFCVEMKGFPEMVDLPPKSDDLAFINGSVWNKLIKTSVIQNTRIPDFKVGEDLCFQQLLYQKCRRIAFTDKVLIHYRVRGDSIITNTQLDTVYTFATELQKLYANCHDANMKDTTALLAFIHIGISMAIRISDNKSVSLKEHLTWTRSYFAKNFDFFKNSSFLRFASLKRRGIKGVAIWSCLLLYKIRAFSVFLVFYKFFTKITRRDVKY